MRKPRIAVTFILFTALSGAQLLNAQRPQPTSRKYEARKTRAVRLQILQQELPKLADSALSLKNFELRIETLGRLADQLWTHDTARARDLFQRTYDLLKAVEPTDDRAQATADSSKVPRSKLIGLYVRFFSRLGKHEPAWKEQLLQNSPEFLSTPGTARNLDLNTANLLLQEKDAKAFDYVEAGISSPATGLANTMQVLDLLMRLRRLDAKKADQLFVQVMRQLDTQGNCPADDLLTIGNYLFTGRPPDDKPQDRVLISPVFVGTVAFHADISYDRPGNSPEIVDRYLRSSASILTRQVDSETTLSQNRAAAFLLLPKSRRFAPDLVPILSNLSSGIDPKRTNSAEARSFIPEPAVPQTVESVNEALDRIVDPVKRDEHCLRAIWSFYLAADFKSAGALTNRMSSPETRDQLASLVSIGQAINTLQKGELDAARLQVQRLPAGKDRSFLSFALAARMIETGDLQSGRVAINSGLADARRTDGPLKASLLLMGSELTSSMDFTAGLSILSETVNVINNLDSDAIDPLRFDRFVRVRAGSQSATFSTDVSGFKSGTVSGAFKAPVARDPNGALTLILQVKNEYVRSLALLAFVSELTS